MIDWGDGTYELTAKTLEPAAKRALDALGPLRNARLLDLGCGTGNVGLEAARRGALVMAVDPSSRLIAQAETRAIAEGLMLDLKVGDGAHIPAGDASLDALVSVFAVIFAPDPEDVAREIVRVLRPGGVAVLTSWKPEGAIFDASSILWKAMPAPPTAPTSRPAWGDPAFVRALFDRDGLDVEIEESTLIFEAASAEAWFDQQGAHHPVWRFVRSSIDESAWGEVRRESIAALAAGSADESSLRVTSRYLVIKLTKPAR